MLISLCIPVMNRAHDLEQTLPYTFAACRASEPAELAILDYNSDDGLGAMLNNIEQVMIGEPLNLKYARYEGRVFYHMAHAWNLAAMNSSGDYLVMMGADAILFTAYLPAIRKLIGEGCVWMRGPHYKGIVCVQRSEFVAAGGYDEQFELYGSEDRDLEARLRRRGGKFGLVPDGLVRTIRTPNEDKARNFRGGLDKEQMIAHNREILAENNRRGVLVANPGGWGAWQ